jgi:hypothetical protein
MENITHQTVEMKANPWSNYQQIDEAIALQKIITDYTKKHMIKGIDYGTIPYSKKPTLLKSGAEKLSLLLKLRPRFELIHSIVDYEKELFHYHYRCQLFRNNEIVAEADGIANSKEKKWVRKPFDFTVVNTLSKMSVKRAFVAAVLIACAASEFFTQDIEDYQ